MKDELMIIPVEVIDFQSGIIKQVRVAQDGSQDALFGDVVMGPSTGLTHHDFEVEMARLKKKWGEPKEEEKYGDKLYVFGEDPRIEVKEDTISNKWDISVEPKE